MVKLNSIIEILVNENIQSESGKQKQKKKRGKIG